MKWHVLILACAFAAQVHAAISVRDDLGDTVTLPRPAQRIATLAPHTTELVFAAGGGDKIVGTTSHSDYPPAARRIPIVGDNQRIDMERLLALKPDLLVVWVYHGSDRQLTSLRRLGIPIFYSEPRKLEDVPAAIERLGLLLGTGPQAQPAATDLRRQLSSLAAQYRPQQPVRMFYQVWDQPLYTLNGEHIINDAIRLCGGENIFAGLPAAAPNVDIEAVLQENPEAVIAGEMHTQPKSTLDMWKKYPSLLATRNGNLFSVNADLLNRPGPRIIAGTAALCERLEQARTHRKQHR